MLMGLLIVICVLLVAMAPFLLLTPRAPKPAGRIAGIAGLEAYFDALTASETPPALDVVVMKDGSVVYSKAFGIADGPARRTATPDGVYHFWSVTKLFTATAVMQLVEDGGLSLDDVVTKYLPDFKTVAPDGTSVEITIRQLLDHTSGMKDLRPTHLVGWLHHLTDPPVNQTALVRDRMAAYRKLASRPGTISAYSNAGYIVLGAIIEAASGGTYEDFVLARILRPLAMNSTDFVYRSDLLPRAVAGSHPLFHIFTPLLPVLHPDWFSRWVAKTEKRRMWLAPLYTDYTPPTGLIGTGEDLARFGQVFLSGGEWSGRRILGPETVSKMLNDGYGGNSGPDRDRMGLGWHWWSDAPMPFKGHGGDGPGFGAQLAIFPELGMVVVVLANDMLIDRVGLTGMIAETFAGVGQVGRLDARRGATSLPGSD